MFLNSSYNHVEYDINNSKQKHKKGKKKKKEKKLAINVEMNVTILKPPFLRCRICYKVLFEYFVEVIA